MTRTQLAIVSAWLLAWPAICPHAARAQGDGQETYYTNYRKAFLAQAARTTLVAPDIHACAAGRLSDATQAEVVDTLNDIRRRHGLGPVSYDPRYDTQVMQAALMIAANGQLSHDPAKSWLCYTDEGHEGASNSVIFGGLVARNPQYYTPSQVVVSWLSDVRNVKGGIGHRMWLLDPSLRTISYGQVAGAFDDGKVSEGAAMKVFGGEGQKADRAPDYPPRIIAYPYGDYPAKYYEDGAILSFAVDVPAKVNPSVSYEKTSISIQIDNGAWQPVKIVGKADVPYWAPVFLEFDAGPLTPGIKYSVKVKDVEVNGVYQDFDYGFELVGETDKAR